MAIEYIGSYIGCSKNLCSMHEWASGMFDLPESAGLGVRDSFYVDINESKAVRRQATNC